MKNGSWMAMGALVGLMATATVRADFPTVDADPYAPGTDVSNILEGATLSHVSFASGAYQWSPVYSAGCTPSTDPTCNALGLASFGWLTPSSTVYRFWSSRSLADAKTCLTIPTSSGCTSTTYPLHLLELSLDADTGFIQFDATYVSDFADVLAFDAAGNVITVTKQLITLQTSNSRNPYGHQAWKITSTTGNIRRLWIAGNGGFVTVNRISFDRTAPTCPIEEPQQ